MNWTVIELHSQTLNTIIDAAIPNKAQNVAVKKQVTDSVNVLMNRIADGWLDEKIISGNPTVADAPEQVVSSDRRPL